MHTLLRFYTNVFKKHIEKLEKLKAQLVARQTTGNIPMKVTPEEAAKVDESLTHIQAAIDKLKEANKER